jgi:hypothetical protein
LQLAASPGGRAGWLAGRQAGQNKVSKQKMARPDVEKQANKFMQFHTFELRAFALEN